MKYVFLSTFILPSSILELLCNSKTNTELLTPLHFLTAIVTSFSANKAFNHLIEYEAMSGNKLPGNITIKYSNFASS